MAVPIKTILTIFLLAIVAFTLRLLAILPSPRRPPLPKKRGTPTHLLIVLGSGGHTAEMTAMLRNAVKGRQPPPRHHDNNPPATIGGSTGSAKLLDWRNYTHRTWIVSSGDSFSATRAKEVEEEFRDYYSPSSISSSSSSASPSSSSSSSSSTTGTYTIITVPRARKIHQSLLTTPLSSLHCLYSCIRLLLSPPSASSSSSSPSPSPLPDLPDLILTNGPATSTILILATYILRFFNIRHAHSRGKCRTIYVESFARVRKMSLSGRILMLFDLIGGGSNGGGAGGGRGVVERCLVQWEGLTAGGKQGGGGGDERGKPEYLGVLV